MTCIKKHTKRKEGRNNFLSLWMLCVCMYVCKYEKRSVLNLSLPLQNLASYQSLKIKWCSSTHFILLVHSICETTRSAMSNVLVFSHSQHKDCPRHVQGVTELRELQIRIGDHNAEISPPVGRQKSKPETDNTVNTQNVPVTKTVDLSSIQCVESKYGLRIQFLSLVVMIHEVGLIA